MSRKERTEAGAQVDWEAYAENYDTLKSLKPYQALMRDVAEEAIRRDGTRLLDAGCGTGNLVTHLHASKALSITGIDSSPTMLARACAKHPETEFIHADLDSALPFDDDAFDTVVCVNALYAVPRPAHTLAEFRRVLRQDGSLIVATPKRGYENGLILKAHCSSEKPDAYWLGVHTSPEREEALVREAIPDEELVKAMLSIAEVNRHIARNTQFHFFTEAALREVVCDAWFCIERMSETYADQSHLIVATAS